MAKGKSGENLNYNLDSHQEMQSFGQKFVGLGFNPAGDINVAEVKQLMARTIDILNAVPVQIGSTNDQLRNFALHDILQAQMMAVKFLTFK